MSEREEKLRAELFARFESMGETEVRLMDANPNLPPMSEDIRYSRVWLALREADKRDKREEETLSIARDANAIALSAKASVRYDRYIAIAAVIIAAIAAHKEIRWLISSVMSWFSK